MARGERPIPGWVDVEAIDDGLGQHLSADPRIAMRRARCRALCGHGAVLAGEVMLDE